MRKIVLIAFIVTLMTGCIPFLPGYGGGGPSQEYYREERCSVTAVTTLTGDITSRGRSYYGDNYNPGNNYYRVNDHHEKSHHPKHKKDNKDEKHKKHHDDD